MNDEFRIVEYNVSEPRYTILHVNCPALQMNSTWFFVDKSRCCKCYKEIPKYLILQLNLLNGDK